LFFVENCIIFISSILSILLKMSRSRQTARKSTGGCFPVRQLAPRYPAAQVEAQSEEVQQVVGDYPIQVQPEMVEQEHQEIQPQEDIE
jgi:hypothetical protein